MQSAIEKEHPRKWRKGYAKHVIKLQEESAKSAGKAMAAAKAGLNYLHDTITFIRDGKEQSLNTAMKVHTILFHQTFS